MCWVMDSVMSWRSRALSRRVNPDRPNGSATMWGPAGLALALFLCLAVTGCADRGRAADEDRPGGFYAGAGGGMTRR